MGTYFDGICDFWGNCELYVKILVNNKEICRTSYQRDKDSVDFHKTCISSKIRKTATIKFELWDKDFNDDDLLAKWEKNAMQLSGSEKFQDRSSAIRVCTFWRDEYLEE